MTDLLSRLSAHALEKYPVKMAPTTLGEIDVNGMRRDIYLSGAIACYELMAREIASEAMNWMEREVMEGAAIYATDEETSEVQFSHSAKAEYLKQFPEPKNELDGQ